MATPITTLRLTREDKLAVRELRMLLGRAARRDGMATTYNATQAIRTAVYTLRNQLAKAAKEPGT